jgi:endonuclease YncB( thermonuclease family)
MRKICLFLLFIILLASCTSGLKVCRDCDYTIKVTAITDGDTFKGLTSDETEMKFRIYGIDAPEKKQPFGNRSKQYLSDLIFGQTVYIKSHGKDRYNRWIAQVYTKEGRDVSAEMLKAGMAWHYKQYDNSERYAKLENISRSKKRGLWKDKTPIPPWKYRK